MPISTPRRSARTAWLSAACALALTTLLTACGGGGDDAKDSKADGVASIETGKPGAGAKGGSGDASSDSGRPQWRLDSTDEEIETLWVRYYGCLKENGVHMTNVRGHELPARPDGKVLTDNSVQEPKAAYTKCKIKMPLMPDVLDSKKNPKYEQQLAADVKCMQDKGMKVALGGDKGTEWSFTGKPSGLSNAQENKIEKACELEAFGGKH
ncbi:hypothetical protein ACFU99_32005 [Streptomyces sp. NPDC057654]|uniref:hypothetical protein n=1 Tax=Streptomyces sp. NPDC057654 TaxID=3346196 RepID=UPI0036C6330E